MVDIADILIVGSGASGAAAAWSLSQVPGVKVVCLEQGGATLPERYPSIAADWELRRQDSYNPSPNVRRLPADYPIDDSSSPIAIANYNAVGGSTILYSGHFPRFHPSDFRTKSLDGVGDDWPLSYAELLPFFKQNEGMMGVAGLVGDTANPDYDNLLPPVPLGPVGRRLGDAFNKLGWHWWPSYSAINTHKHQGRAPCVNLGPCNTGCPQGAKASVDRTYWPAAKAMGVTLMPHARVSQITLDAAGRASGAAYIDADGRENHVKARMVVLACNGIGTPRLLLNSKSPAFPDGLANDTGLVGKNLMLHPLGFVEGVFEENLHSSLGPHGCCLLSQQFYETDRSRGFVRGYTMQILRGAPAVETATAGLLRRQISIGKNHHRDFARIFNRTAGIAIITEDLPEAHNYVELDPANKDSNGLPGVKIHYALSENSTKMLKHGIEMGRQVIEAAGGKVISAISPVRHTGWHLMGTTRMGDKADNSVVNRHGQTHSVKNLFVVDSSIFVTAGAVNPVATAQALSLYVCDHIKRNLSKIL
jgi:choline dehydrogenase-like flavoprotein